MLVYLWEEGPLLSLLLQAVGHESPHGLGAVAAHLAEVRRQVASANHEDDLHRKWVSGVNLL